MIVLALVITLLSLACGRSVRLARQRLENHGPEIFARLR
jgi:hypothetical protein